MGDLEFFGGMDMGGESFDAASFEKFKERIKQAAAQLKALQKSEQKQKKTEDELIKILIKFIKSGKKKDILLLVTRLLEMNVPAGFIVALLVISNKEIQDELKIKMLPAGPIDREEAVIKKNFEGPNAPELYMGAEILPLKVKIAIANWINEITRRVNEKPQKVIKTVLDRDKKVQLSAIQLGAFCLRDFLEQQKIEQNYDQLKDFITFILNDIINKAVKELKERKELKTDRIE